MIHVMNALLAGYTHSRGTGHLLRFYLHHHALQFLMSGVTSESPSNRCQAYHLLGWLTQNHISPRDW